VFATLLLKSSAGAEDRYMIVEARIIHAQLVQPKMNVIATILFNIGTA
jgi:hypothetical protein